RQRSTTASQTPPPALSPGIRSPGRPAPYTRASNGAVADEAEGGIAGSARSTTWARAPADSYAGPDVVVPEESVAKRAANEATAGMRYVRFVIELPPEWFREPRGPSTNQVAARQDR